MVNVMFEERYKVKVSVLGCGRWGSFIAWYLNKINHNVMLWGRESSANMINLKKFRKNNFLSLDPKILLSSNLEEALSFAEVVVISISAQSLRSFLNDIKLKIPDLKNRIFILCMKGMEKGTGKRLTEVLEECLGKVRAAVWVGPGHVQDFINGIPNCMVIDSTDSNLKHFIIENFSSSLIRFYYGTDLIGSEIGAASKNVMGIAAGILDGLEYTSLKGALMSRGTREIARLIKALGGNEFSAYGLAHLGDYQATLFSPHSNNRKFGESLITGEKYEKLAEGVPTTEALLELGLKLGVELPICQAVHDVVSGKMDAKERITKLFLRSLKTEF